MAISTSMLNQFGYEQEMIRKKMEYEIEMMRRSMICPPNYYPTELQQKIQKQESQKQTPLLLLL